MAITAVLTFLTLLFVVALLSGIGLMATSAARGRPIRMGLILLIIGLIGILIAIPLNAGLVLIQPSEVGVVFRQLGNTNLREPLGQGLKWVVPFVDQVTIYNAGQQNVDMLGVVQGGNTQAPVGAGTGGQPAVSAITKDGQQIYLDVTVIFQIDPKRVNEIHRSWPSTRDNQRYIDGFIIPQTRSAVRDATSRYSAEQIYSGGRATLENEITTALADKFTQEGFILTSILIRNIAFSNEFTQAIEQKQIAQQQAQQAVFRVQQAQQEAEQARVEAQGKADAAVIAAQGQAQATVLQAEAQAKGLAAINEILSQNPNLIQYQYINQLGDNVKLIIVPSNSPFLFNMQDLLNQANESVPVPAGPTPLPTQGP